MEGFSLTKIIDLAASVLKLLGILRPNNNNPRRTEKQSYPRVKSKICSYFIESKAKKINYVIFQLGRRPDLPLVELLYLEYLHNLLINDQVENILIFASKDLSASKQDSELFQKNVKKLFCNFEDHIHFYDPMVDVTFDNTDLASLEFKEFLEYLCGKEHFTFVNGEPFNLGIRNITDFNKYRKAESKIFVLVTHLIAAWQIVKYLKQNMHTLPHYRATDCLEIGFIVWETEVGKMGMYHKFVIENNKLQKSTRINESYLLGKTLKDDKDNPLPVFDEDKALTIFQDLIHQFPKIKNCSADMLRTYITIIEVILSDNYNRSFNKAELVNAGKSLYLRLIGSHTMPDVKYVYDTESYQLIALMDLLYECYNNN